MPTAGEAGHQRRLDHVAGQPRVLADHHAVPVLAVGEQLAGGHADLQRDLRRHRRAVGQPANAVGAEIPARPWLPLGPAARARARRRGRRCSRKDAVGCRCHYAVLSAGISIKTCKQRLHHIGGRRGHAVVAFSHALFGFLADASPPATVAMGAIPPRQAPEAPYGLRGNRRATLLPPPGRRRCLRSAGGTTDRRGLARLEINATVVSELSPWRSRRGCLSRAGGHPHQVRPCRHPFRVKAKDAGR